MTDEYPRSATRPLEPSPAYLRKVPNSVLYSTERGRSDLPDRLLGYLRARGIVARPTLYEIESERARRGMRNLPVWPGTRLPNPALTIDPLPMPERPLDLAEARARARRNRARIEAHGLGGMTAGDAAALREAA